MFEQIRLADVYVHYSDVPFSKGSFVNRVQIKTPTGIVWMTIPVRELTLGQPICDVKINYQKDWRRKHREMLKQSYAKAPFCKDMLDIVDGVYSKHHVTLDALSIASIAAVYNYFELGDRRRFLDIRDLRIPGSSSRRVLDTVLAVGGDSYVTGHGATSYLDHELFECSNVRVEYMDYRMTPYPQLHGPFTPFVSILDLIANLGREGIEYINSGSVYWKEFLDRE